MARSNHDPPTWMLSIVRSSLPHTVDREECIEATTQDYLDRHLKDGPRSAYVWMATTTICTFYVGYKAEVLFAAGAIVAVVLAV